MADLSKYPRKNIKLTDYAIDMIKGNFEQVIQDLQERGMYNLAANQQVFLDDLIKQSEEQESEKH